jgi:hypothetical protein
MVVDLKALLVYGIMVVGGAKDSWCCAIMGFISNKKAEAAST